MSLFETFLVSRFMVFTLVLSRTSGMMLAAPIFSSKGIPRQVRALLAVMMALLVTPVYLGTSLPPIQNLAEYGRLLANEVLLGLLLGLGVNILLSGTQVAGQLVSQLSGLTLADIASPGFDEDQSVFSQLFYFVTLAVFVAIGGHRMLTEALLDTFAWAPPGHAALGGSFVDVLTSIMTQSFELGVRAAAPVATVLLLSTLLLGLITRTMPQINIIAVGFGLNSLLTLGLLCVTLGAVAWTFQDRTVDVLLQIQDSLVNGPGL
jgi:flagellar biosynthetic protein FliR